MEENPVPEIIVPNPTPTGSREIIYFSHRSRATYKTDPSSQHFEQENIPAVLMKTTPNQSPKARPISISPRHFSQQSSSSLDVLQR